MKLAKVDHYRCGEPAGKWGLATYVWIPENMSEHQFGVLCETARNNYLANEREWSEAAPAPPPGYGATVQGYPDTMTVSEVKADHAAKTKAYKEHGEKQALARKPFSWLLQQASNGQIKLFWEESPPMMHELDWGHNHGMAIDMGETKIPDFPATNDDEESL